MGLPMPVMVEATVLAPTTAPGPVVPERSDTERAVTRARTVPSPHPVVVTVNVVPGCVPVTEKVQPLAVPALVMSPPVRPVIDSLNESPKVCVVPFVGLVDADVHVATGAPSTGSTVHVLLELLPVTPDTVSLARNVCDPGDRFDSATGLVHAAHAAPSRLHSKVAPAVPEPVNVTVADVDAVVPDGIPETVGAAGETMTVAVALAFTALGVSVLCPPYSTKYTVCVLAQFRSFHLLPVAYTAQFSVVSPLGSPEAQFA
jgi:hypothetical protein